MGRDGVGVEISQLHQGNMVTDIAGAAGSVE